MRYASVAVPSFNAGRIIADTHATTTEFPSKFVEGICQGAKPDWIVTRPPYKDAIKFMRSALAVCGMGAALKLPLSFLGPCADRGSWLSDHPPQCCIFLSRQWHDSGMPRMGEFWGVWYFAKPGACESESRLSFAS